MRERGDETRHTDEDEEIVKQKYHRAYFSFLSLVLFLSFSLFSTREKEKCPVVFVHNVIL